MLAYYAFKMVARGAAFGSRDTRCLHIEDIFVVEKHVHAVK
jgi:hypothetical protein